MGKDSEQAKQFKDDGNKAFQKEDYRTAVRLYSKSILFMPGKAKAQAWVGYGVPPPGLVRTRAKRVPASCLPS